MNSLRILLLADTHLGFDQPRRPRIQKRRRGPDFWANYHRALEPAFRDEVDLVVHGGDLLFRSKVHGDLVLEAFAPLKSIADRGTPVLLVPGNHERSRTPFPIFGQHPGIHIFDRPRTFFLEVKGLVVGLSGFPCQRKGIRESFSALLEKTQYRAQPAHIRLLCLHQTVEGARVGPKNFTFRSGSEVIRGEDLPGDFAAVLAGHIHRHQLLWRTLEGALLPSPVLYPGSIERTSWAEQKEDKGFLKLKFRSGDSGGRLVSWEFEILPCRTMIEVSIGPATDRLGLESQLKQRLRSLPRDAIVRVRLEESSISELPFSGADLRALVPSSMTIDWHLPDRSRRARGDRSE